MRILATDGLDASAVAKLRELGHEVVEQHFEQEEVGKAIRDFDVVVVRSATKIKEKEIDEAKGSRLKMLIRGGVGLDNIAVDYAKAAGLAVRNTPRSPSNAVAELAIGLMFSCARSLADAGFEMKNCKWDKKAYSKGLEIMGKTCGIIGFGRIGQCVGQKAQALGMDVLAVVHKNKPENCECDTMHFVSMDELLAKSDYVVLCCPPAEKPIIDMEAIGKMKKGSAVINVSRGVNVDEAAILEGLNNGTLRAAGLDVWRSEKEGNWELVQHKGVVPTPHIGAGTVEAQARIGGEIVEIIESFK